MYVDFNYYSSTYKGKLIPEDDFEQSEQEAETYIRCLTCLNGDIFSDEAHTEAIKKAVCATAEAYYTAVTDYHEIGGVKSESKDGMSVTFVLARKDGETLDEYARRSMYQAVRMRLLPIGWLSRRAKVGAW